MELLILQASPHKTGNIATIVDTFLGSIDKDTKVNVFNLNEMKINPCQGCFKCQSAKCFIDDDMQLIYPKFHSADIIVFATPIFWWHMNAQMKLLIDRMTALLDTTDSIPALNGKNLVLFVSYKFRKTAEATIQMFNDFIEWAKVKLDVIEYCSAKSHVREDKERLNEVKKLAERITKANYL